MEKMILLFVIIAGSLVFMLSLCKNKVESVLTFLMRSMMGLLGIYIVNRAFEYVGNDLMVGINGATVGMTGLLGLPGFVLLYALSYLFIKA